MAQRARTLSQLVEELRAELRMGNNAALGTNMRATLVQSLQRTQEEVYSAYEWPFLRTDAEVPLLAGTTRYAIPDAIDPGEIQRIFWRETPGQNWNLLDPNPLPSDVAPADEPRRRGAGEGVRTFRATEGVAGSRPARWSSDDREICRPSAAADPLPRLHAAWVAAMPYIFIKDFKAGLDARRDASVAQPGVLLAGNNIHINRGGEVEKRYAFTRVTQLPAATIGLAANAFALTTFGEGLRPPTLDININYMQVNVVGKTIAEVLDWDVFTSKVYASIRYTDGAVRHWYDGAIVNAWTPPVETGIPITAPVYAPLLVLARKMYAGAGNVLFFSGVDNATVWVPNTPSQIGQGFNDLTNAASGAERLVSLASYQGRLAVFTRRSVQIYDVDPDPAQNRLRQTLLNLGTMAPRSVVNFGDGDVFFLSDTGVRSLRARDSSNNAAVSDIGTPVDDMINPAVQALPDQGRECLSVIEPISGRYWLSVGRTIYVFSYYPNGRVAAWSTYTLDFTPVAFATVGNRVFVRGDDNWLYVYGGSTGTDFGADYECVVEPGLIDGGKPATEKHISGFDIGCEGEWSVWLGADPANIPARDYIGKLDRPSWGIERWAAAGRGTHFSMQLRHQGPGPARLSSLAVHYDEGMQA